MTMNDQVSVPVDDVKRLFLLLEDLHAFLHQPENYRSPADVDRFLSDGVYVRLKTMYYQTVWSWLPPEAQQEMEAR